jgi:predicted nucleic acid-binding protein
MPYLVDADWAIQALANRAPATETLRRLAPDGLAISWATVGEVYEGAFGFPDPEAHLAVFRRFLQPFRLIGLDDPLMTRFAELRALLRRRGQLLPDFDLLVGATALEHNLTVLTFNVRHLSRIPGLRIYQPPATP